MAFENVPQELIQQVRALRNMGPGPVDRKYAFAGMLVARQYIGADPFKKDMKAFLKWQPGVPAYVIG